MNIILASNSPRRKKILTDLGLNFEIIPSNYDEKLDSDNFSYEAIEYLATQKALDVAKRVGNDKVVIGADTVVILDNKILGKPHSKAGAFKMLSDLSGKTHSVVTAVCGINNSTGKTEVISTTSYVKFFDLSKEQIDCYIEEFKPFDKAGSYGIQEMPEGYIESYSGSLENIIGLDSNAVLDLLKKLI